MCVNCDLNASRLYPFPFASLPHPSGSPLPSHFTPVPVPSLVPALSPRPPLRPQEGEVLALAEVEGTPDYLSPEAARAMLAATRGDKVAVVVAPTRSGSGGGGGVVQALLPRSRC